MQSRRMSEGELLGSLDVALKDSHIYPCYQPQINHSTGRMVGAEALMRWKNPEYGMQYPSDFIPLLEKMISSTGRMSIFLKRSASS